MIFSREETKEEILVRLKSYPVVVLLGPRQCGKTTLAREIATQRKAAYFDLEDPQSPLQPEHAALTLAALTGLVILDEFQWQPSLFPLLRVFADRKPIRTRFLLLGSASMDLIKGVSESLAGRAAFVSMAGLRLGEVGSPKMDTLWVRGGFPRSFLARERQSFDWRLQFVRTFLERDIPQLGIRIPSPALRRFWTLIAHVHGQNWNGSDLARAMSVKEDTVRHYLDILSSTFMVRQLQPWFENTKKRLVKAPKVYFRDSGLLHALLGLKNKNDLLSHPKLGFSWEGFALEEILSITRAERDAYFYKTHAGAELDLLVMHRGKRYGFEFKYHQAPLFSASMRIVLADLKLSRLWVIYPGQERYSIGKNTEVLPLSIARKWLPKVVMG